MIRRVLSALVLLALASSCAAPIAQVTVSPPKVWGDDHVLRGMAERARSMRALAAGAEGSRTQENLSVAVSETDRLTLGANLADTPTSSALPTPPALPSDRDVSVRVRSEPIPGLTWNESFRQQVDRAELVRAYEALFTGDVQLLERHARCVLLRFDVCFTNYLDLGERRRFVVVGFVVRGKGNQPVPRFEVYLLTPEYSAFASRETLAQASVDQLAAQLLGTWGGTGVSGGWGTTSEVREQLEAVLETPLQFGILGPRSDDGERCATFAFAFGPRRRLVERSVLNPTRWLGSPWEIAYEIQPGPRPCQALLLFPDGNGPEPVDLVVSVLADGALVAEEEVSLGLALGNHRIGAFEVEALPIDDDDGATTTVLDLVPEVGADLVVASGCDGPSFSAQSEVLIGPALVREVRPLGRGRLLVHVKPLAELVAELRDGKAEVAARVVTPDQRDFVFRMRLRGVRR